MICPLLLHRLSSYYHLASVHDPNDIGKKALWGFQGYRCYFAGSIACMKPGTISERDLVLGLILQANDRLPLRPGPQSNIPGAFFQRISFNSARLFNFRHIICSERHEQGFTSQTASDRFVLVLYRTIELGASLQFPTSITAYP